jgi:hypothetical protein
MNRNEAKAGKKNCRIQYLVDEKIRQESMTHELSQGFHFDGYKGQRAPQFLRPGSDSGRISSSFITFYFTEQEKIPCSEVGICV